MHNYSLRSILVITVPSITALLGLIWYFGRKKKEDSDAPGKTPSTASTQSRTEKEVSETSSRARATSVSIITKGRLDIRNTENMVKDSHELEADKQKKTFQSPVTVSGKGGDGDKLSSQTTISPSSVSPMVAASQGHVDVSPNICSSGDASQNSTANVSPPSPRILSKSSGLSKVVHVTLEASDSGDGVSSGNKQLRSADVPLRNEAEKSCDITNGEEQRSADVPVSKEQETAVVSKKNELKLSSAQKAPELSTCAESIMSSPETSVSLLSVSSIEERLSTSKVGAVASSSAYKSDTFEQTSQESIPSGSDLSPVAETFSCTSSATIHLSAEKPQSWDVPITASLKPQEQFQSDPDGALPETLNSTEKKAVAESVMEKSEDENCKENIDTHLDFHQCQDVSTSSKADGTQPAADLSSNDTAESAEPQEQNGHDSRGEVRSISSSEAEVGKDVCEMEEKPCDLVAQKTSEESVFMVDQQSNVDNGANGIPKEAVFGVNQEDKSSSPITDSAKSSTDNTENMASSALQHAQKQVSEDDTEGCLTALENQVKKDSSLTESSPSETATVLLDSVADVAKSQTSTQSGSTSSASEQNQQSKKHPEHTTPSGGKKKFENQQQSSRSKADPSSSSPKPKSYKYDNKWSNSKHEAAESRKENAEDVLFDRHAEEAGAVRVVMENGRMADPGSPSCDTNSEESNDSGRGGSVGENLVALSAGELVHYEFNFPSDLCGRLIGRGGRNIHYIKEESGATVSLASNPFTPEYQICRVQGVQAEVDRALLMIQKKFPLAQYPQLDMTPIGPPRPTPIIIPDVMQLNLPEGVSVEVVVSAIVNAGHIFVQQPTHPTFPSIERLQLFMNNCYSDQNVPLLPRPVEAGVICSSESEGQWYRTQVIQVYLEDDTCDIKYVDYGGYARVPVNSLRQIRTDFMTLPFQAVECYLANITPLQEEDYFSEKASLQLAELTAGKVLQGQVIVRGEDNIPYIHLYQVSGHSVLLINRELVNREVVRWIEIL